MSELRPILHAAEFGDLQPEMRDHPSRRSRPPRAPRPTRPPPFGSGPRRRPVGHGEERSRTWPKLLRPAPKSQQKRPSRPQPAFAGRCVQRELRQSILSSKHATADLASFSINVTVADPSFSSVVLLCGFDGADGARTSTDESSFARSLTFVGSAQLDAAQSTFGASSVLFDGSGDRNTCLTALACNLVPASSQSRRLSDLRCLMPIPAGSWARWLDGKRFGVVLHGAGDAQNVDMNGWLDEFASPRAWRAMRRTADLQCRLRLTHAFKLSRRSPAHSWFSDRTMGSGRGGTLFHQSLTTGETYWKARAVTVNSTTAGILEECGSGSDSSAGRRIAGAASAARLGFRPRCPRIGRRGQRFVKIFRN